MTEIVPPVAELEEMKNLVNDAPVKVRKKRAPKHDFKDGRGRVFAHRHVNGEGWVADTAKVADTVFVAKTAQVYHQAVIFGRVQLRNRAKVCGTAELMDTARVENDAFVGGDAIIADSTKVKDNATIYGGTLQGSTIVRDRACVRDDAVVMGTTLSHNCIISGHANVINSTLTYNATISGAANVVHAEISGYVSVYGNATVAHSHIFHNRTYSSDPNVNRVHIKDSVIVAHVERLDAWLDLIGHAMIVRGNLNFRPAYNNNVYEKLTSHTMAAIVQLTTTDHAQFLRYNVPPQARAAVVAADTFAAHNPSSNGVARAPVNLDTLTPSRRIMSFDGAAS